MATIAYYHKLSGFNTTEIYCLTILEARSLKPKCWLSQDLFEVSKGVQCCLFQLLLALGITWFVAGDIYYIVI